MADVKRAKDAWIIVKTTCPYCDHVQSVDDEDTAIDGEPEAQDASMDCAKCGLAYTYGGIVDWLKSS